MPNPDFVEAGPSLGSATSAQPDATSDTVPGDEGGSDAAGASGGGTTGSTSRGLPADDESGGPATANPEDESAFACADASLGSALGIEVVQGTTQGASNDWDPSCEGDGAADLMYTWTAPTGGTFTFDTNGSSLDTVLALLASCDGPELTCNDDASNGWSSRVSIELEAGETVLVVVDGYGDEAGPFQLNIRGS